MGKREKLNRISRLFTPGDILVIRDERGEVVETMYVSALTAFDEQDVESDAQTGKVRAMLRFDADEDAQAKLTEKIAEMSNDQLAGALVYDKQIEHFNRARADVLADPDWAERISLVENQDLEGATAEDKAVVDQISQDFAVELARRKAELDTDLLADLAAAGRATLEQDYRKSFRGIQGVNGYFEYQKRSQVRLALRDCEATLVDGEWNHDACGFHTARILDATDEMNLVPDAVMREFNRIWEDLRVTPEDAGKSVAPSASSGSLERQRLAEVSTPSTPAETSSEPQQP